MSIKPEWYFNDSMFSRIWEQASAYTMTSPERGYALYNAVKYIIQSDIPGNFVESGVWKGGSAMIMALTLVELNCTSRQIWLFDTFEGMPPPQEHDIDLSGKTAHEQLDAQSDNADESLVWAIAGLKEVKRNLGSTHYPMQNIHFVQGDVARTAPNTKTGPVALLRLDTDWYASTRAELDNFWHRLIKNGVLIIDDYGHWQGAQKAVDEFFNSSVPNSPAPVLLQPIDYTGRICVRTEPNTQVKWDQRYDCRPAVFNAPDLLPFFPHLVDTDPATCPDPRVRRAVPHIWRTDGREKSRATGNISTEEAALLYAIAHTRKERFAIEVGSHFGWSTAHIISAGLTLDAIDPAFSDATRFDQVSTSLTSLQCNKAATLWPGYSPHIVDAVAATRTERYGFAFIDGKHDDDGPLQDTKAVMPYLAEDAVLVFHDLTFHDVATAVRYLKAEGWLIRVYNTMQVMAAAWRVGTPPPVYHGDKQHDIGLPANLRDLASRTGESIDTNAAA